MKRIAVLMACYNRALTTLECLRRLFSQKMPEGYSFDVWLVDDASPDRTGEKVKAAYPSVNVIQGTGKLFWCKGMRLAWENAAEAYDYDFYMWLNDDTMLQDGALGSLVRDAVLCGGGIVAGAVSDPGTGRVCYGVCGASGMIIPDGIQPTRASGRLNGNVLVVSRNAYRQIGMIDEFYSHGTGDNDYGMMAIRKGVPIYVSSNISGTCRFNKGKTGLTADMSLHERWRLLFSPLGFPLKDTWHYRKKFHGTMRAFASCVHVAFNVLTGRR